MTKKTFLIDCDGVLLDWTSALPEFIRNMGLCHRKSIELIANRIYFDVQDLFPGASKNWCHQFVEDFCTSKHMGTLMAIPGAVSGMRELAKEYRFVCITAIGTDPEIKKLREHNLESWFPGMFDDVICVGYGDTKLDYLRKFESTIWVDDSPRYVKEGLEAGHRGIRLVNDTRVDPFSQYEVAGDWKELLNLVR